MYNLAKKYLLLGLSLSLLIVATIFFFDQKKQTIPQTEIATTKLIKSKHIKYEGAVLVNEPDNIDYIITELEDIETAGAFSLAAMAQSITTEALKAFTDSDEHTLPLLSHWNVGIPELIDAMNPMYMIDRIEQGEYILVSWKLDPYYADTIGSSYYEESIKRAAELQLPLVFILPAPESALTKDNYYKSLPKTENSNVVDKDGNVLNKLSPFGPDDKWKEVGEQWSTTSLMSQIQEWYPNPPLVIFTSEDEANKLTWNEIDISSRYLEYYSESSPDMKDDNYKRTLIGGKWIEKYRQLQNGFKEGFTKSAWKDNIKFISYNKLSDNFGKSADWIESATVTNQYINLWPLATDGATIDFDLTGSKSDITEDSPHVLANNLPFMLKEAKSKNPGFAYQLSIDDDSKITDTARYRGLTQFALWFLRPNIIRQKSSATTRAELEPKFEELIDSVNLIHYNPEIAEFWKSGELVSNGSSLLNNNIPEQYKDDPRWFLLDSNSDDQKVWAFALVKGEAPNREWLLYAQSPEGDVSNVSVSISDNEDVLINSTKDGSFYILSENSTPLEIISKAEEPIVEEDSGIIIGARPVVSTPLENATKFASPNGNGDGTVGNPYSIVDAFNSLVAGDVLFLRGGSYDIPINGLRVDGKNGTEENPIIIESYPNEIAILDGKNRTAQDVIDGTYPTSTTGGFQLTHLSSYIYVRKVEITGMSLKGVFLGGHHCKIEGCNIHHNFGAGLHSYDNINGYTVPFVGGWHTITDNLIHDNSDAGIIDGSHNDGDNSDGISISSGQSNYVGHNTIYANSDDGADSWKSNDTIFEYNIIHSHGLGEKGNGNGIKMGGDATDSDGNGKRCIARYNLIYNNKAAAFDSSTGWDTQVLYNTTWNNAQAVINFGNARRNIIAKNLSYNDGTISLWGDGYSSNYTNNSWNIGETVTVESTDPLNADFLRPTSSAHLSIGALAQ